MAVGHRSGALEVGQEVVSVLVVADKVEHHRGVDLEAEVANVLALVVDVRAEPHKGADQGALQLQAMKKPHIDLGVTAVKGQEVGAHHRDLEEIR